MKEELEYDEMIEDNGQIVLGYNSPDVILEYSFKKGDKVQITAKKGEVTIKKVPIDYPIKFMCEKCEEVYGTNRKKCKCGHKVLLPVSKDKYNRLVYLSRV